MKALHLRLWGLVTQLRLTSNLMSYLILLNISWIKGICHYTLLQMSLGVLSLLKLREVLDPNHQLLKIMHSEPTITEQDGLVQSKAGDGSDRVYWLLFQSILLAPRKGGSEPHVTPGKLMPSAGFLSFSFSLPPSTSLKQTQTHTHT